MRFAYFMVRISVGADTRSRSSGVVERLGTGRKRAFSNIEELVRLLTDGSDDPENMEVGTVGGNEPTVTPGESNPPGSLAPNNQLGDT